MTTILTTTRPLSPPQFLRSIPDSAPAPVARALVLADDERAARLLSSYLTHGRFATELVPMAGASLAEIGRYRPHVIFLGLSDDSGSALAWCAEALGTTSTPIIACSTSRDVAPLVSALQAGADDYFVLPMRTAEFASRVRAILRRVRRSSASAAPDDRIIAGNLEVRPQEHRAFRNGKLVDLSPTEFRLLTILVRHAGRTVSHRKLLAQVWGHHYTDGGASLRIYIRRLRAKLGDDSLITSTRSIGYCLQPTTALESPAAYITRSRIGEPRTSYIALRTSRLVH